VKVVVWSDRNELDLNNRTSHRETRLVSPTEHSDEPKSQLGTAAEIERASRLFRALGDPARLRLMARLAHGEVCVTELAEAENEELSTISQRLRVLQLENIVVRHRRGKHINYALTDQHMLDLVNTVIAHAGEPAMVANETDTE
jgi:DNA-binding transcriptional ArsR family regulator